MRKRGLSWTEIRASIAELRNSQRENERIFNERFAKTEKFLGEVGVRLGEVDARLDKVGAHIEEVTANINRVTANVDKIGVKVNGVNSRVDGIGDSNGRFAEEYFLNSLERKMEFAGVHFDDIAEFKRSMKMPSGEKLKGQFDIVMINDDAVAIIEIKYKANNKHYLHEMVERKVPNFRTLFPDYKDYRIYLGLGAMSFDDKVVEEAKELGIGLLRQIGETIEYETGWVRAH